MTDSLKLTEVVDTINSMSDADEIRTYSLSIISLLQKEIQKTRSNVEDFRNTYGFNKDDDLFRKSKVVNVFVDPVINAEILALKKELYNTSEELKNTRHDLEAQQFNPQSSMGKRLIEKCRNLQLENQELYRIVLESQIQPLTLDLFKEKERNKVLEKELKSLYQLNINLDKDNEVLTKKIDELSYNHLDSKKDKKRSERKRDESKTIKTETSKSRRSKSPRRGSLSRRSPRRVSVSRKSPRRSISPRRKERPGRDRSHSRNIDRRSPYRNINRTSSRDRSRTRIPRSRRS